LGKLKEIFGNKERKERKEKSVKAWASIDHFFSRSVLIALLEMQ
jgi:hypothetical protein